MRIVEYEPEFLNSLEKHLKRISKNERIIVRKDYDSLISLLQTDVRDIPTHYKVHKLRNKGELFEAHLGGRYSDTLILYRKELQDGIPTLSLIRICTHRDLDIIRAAADYDNAAITAAYIDDVMQWRPYIM